MAAIATAINIGNFRNCVNPIKRKEGEGAAAANYKTLPHKCREIALICTTIGPRQWLQNASRCV